MVLAALGARTMRTRSLALGIAAILGVVACGCGGNAGAPVSDDVAAATTAPAVSTAAPRSEARVPAASDILSVLSVEHQVDLAAERDGVVLAVSKDEGNAVRAGDVLAQLDDRDLQMQLVKAGDDLRVAQNNVQYKEAEVKAKDAAFRRQQELRQYGLSSEADLEQAEFEAKGAEYDLHGWQALVESSEAEVRQIQIEIDQTRVRAPFSGVVVSRYIRQGEALKKGDRCFRVSQLAPLEVRFQVPESSPQRPRRGAPVALSLVSNSSALTARIVKISPTVDPASDSYDVVAQLPETRRSELLPGMAVRVHWPAAAPAKPQP
jgi:RND family efflux transporter MFP subunit